MFSSADESRAKCSETKNFIFEILDPCPFSYLLARSNSPAHIRAPRSHFYTHPIHACRAFVDICDIFSYHWEHRKRRKSVFYFKSFFLNVSVKSNEPLTNFSHTLLNQRSSPQIISQYVYTFITYCPIHCCAHTHLEQHLKKARQSEAKRRKEQKCDSLVQYIKWWWWVAFMQEQCLHFDTFTLQIGRDVYNTP